MTVINIYEKQKLNVMYEGDVSRDASDKIRGFLFQDLIAIDSLLVDDTECVCLEYLEDVDVFCNDGTVKIIQAKYYPQSGPIMKEIMTDLYYQYLRMQLLESKLESKPQLVIHSNKDVTKPDFGKMQLYFDVLKKKKPKKIIDLPNWLKENVYICSKKDEQKKALFDKTAYEASIVDFLNKFEIIKKKDIKSYKKEIENKLFEIVNTCNVYDEIDQQKSILIGLAVSYMQRRYMLDNPSFEKIKVERAEFIDYIQQTMQFKTEEHMIAYMNACVLEQYTTIMTENPDLCEDYILLLNYIVQNTQKWISKVVSSEEGQFQLLNTISLKSYDDIKDYSSLSVSQKIAKLIACTDGLQTFLFYLWKIMINLCMEKSDFYVAKDGEMLNPLTYIDKSVNKYICLNFKGDFVRKSVILPTVRTGQKERDYANISSRMYLEKPQKWYMAGYACGRKDYVYKVSGIREEDSIIDLETDSYIVECMECIKIDRETWKNIENCETCIFAKECVKGKEN